MHDLSGRLVVCRQVKLKLIVWLGHSQFWYYRHQRSLCGDVDIAALHARMVFPGPARPSIPKQKILSCQSSFAHYDSPITLHAIFDNFELKYIKALSINRSRFKLKKQLGVGATAAPITSVP
jgi:hypothetical protein